MCFNTIQFSIFQHWFCIFIVSDIISTLPYFVWLWRRSTDTLNRFQKRSLWFLPQVFRIHYSLFKECWFCIFIFSEVYFHSGIFHVIEMASYIKIIFKKKKKIKRYVEQILKCYISCNRDGLIHQNYFRQEPKRRSSDTLSRFQSV